MAKRLISYRDIVAWMTQPPAPTSPRCGESTQPSFRRPVYRRMKCSTSSAPPRGVHALWVLGSNIAVSAPHAGHVANRLRDLDFLVVSDFFLSETAAMADMVLPSAQWAEETGTITNLEGRVILRKAAISPPEGIRSDLSVMQELADRLNRPALSDDPRHIFQELGRASAGGLADYSGITYERIVAEQGVFWPCPSPDHPGTPRLFTEDFPTPSRRALFHPVEHHGPAETPDAAYPYYLTTGRLLRHYQSGTQTRRVVALFDAEPDAIVEMHATLARRIGVKAGDWVSLRTRRGDAAMRVRITVGIRPDTVFAPFHYGGAAAVNLLTNPALDPHSRMPEFKACAVAIEAISGTPGNRSTRRDHDE